MKKLLFLAAFILLGNAIISCEDVHNDSKEQFLASDDVIVPIKPPTKP